MRVLLAEVFGPKAVHKTRSRGPQVFATASTAHPRRRREACRAKSIAGGDGQIHTLVIHELAYNQVVVFDLSQPGNRLRCSRADRSTVESLR